MLLSFENFKQHQCSTTQSLSCAKCKLTYGPQLTPTKLKLQPINPFSTMVKYPSAFFFATKIPAVSFLHLGRPPFWVKKSSLKSSSGGLKSGYAVSFKIVKIILYFCDKPSRKPCFHGSADVILRCGCLTDIRHQIANNSYITGSTHVAIC